MNLRLVCDRETDHGQSDGRIGGFGKSADNWSNNWSGLAQVSSESVIEGHGEKQSNS